MKIQADRLKQGLLELAELGKNEEGINRLTYTEEFWKSNAYVAQKMREAGMRVRTNPVGNLIGSYAGRTARRIAVGSHIDSVRNAGMFDGCLGVMAAIEVVRTLNEHGVVLNHTIDAAAWAEEEGLVIGGLFGSLAYCGLPYLEGWKTKIRELGITPQDIEECRAEGPVDCSVELHIEQGGVLDEKKKDIGVVTAIFAIRRYKVIIEGTANHAGSTPMYLRDDAMVKAARLIGRFPALVHEVDEEMVGTIGRVEVKPNFVNTIPGRVALDLEMRAVKEESLDCAYTKVIQEFSDIITSITPTMQERGYRMDETVRAAIWDAAADLGMRTIDIASGAAHDTVALAQITKPGMIFVPSVDGISHSSREWTDWDDVTNGANVLLQTILKLDQTI